MYNQNNANLTKQIEKVDGLDVVVEAYVDTDGKVVSQKSFTKTQVETQKANAQRVYDTAIERFNALLAVLDQA